MQVKPEPRRRRPVRLGAALLVVAMAAQGAARAEEATASFFIETITVEAERLTPDIVLSEALLREGREYSESELREAVHRINRLPFVLLAEFSLRKGSERGLYELVIKVYEARRWFSQLNLGIALNDSYDRFRADDFDSSFLRTDDDFDALIGRRFAVGRRGLLFASFGTESGLFAVGYQHYNLWDRNILFSLTVAGENQAGGQARTARAQLGIPIRGNHGLRLLAARSWYDYASFLLPGGAESRETELEIAWVFNSRDDPVLPREGSLFELGLAGSSRHDRRRLVLVDGVPELRRTSEDRLAIVASGARHWPLTARQSVSAGIGGFAGDSQTPGRRWQAEAVLGHQVFLRRNQEPGKWRELRLETELAGFREEYRVDLLGQGFAADGLSSWRLRTGLTYRTGWGLFRFFVEHAERSFQ